MTLAAMPAPEIPFPNEAPAAKTMRALVYRGLGTMMLENRPKPVLTDVTDAIVKITRTTICATDLYILEGKVPTCEPGRILGHEGVGIVEEVGRAVTLFEPGDHVLISCNSACGECEYCRRHMYSRCVVGGWILGNKIDGTQAEYVRTPYADRSLHLVPNGADEESLVMLSDILPTGFECGVLSGKVAPGQTVAIVGCGPIGLAALLTVRFFSPVNIIVIGLDDNWLEAATGFGATAVVNASRSDGAAAVMALTGGRGVDIAIEAVGTPATFALCEDIVMAGGRIANVGLHGAKTDLSCECRRDRNIAIATRMVDTATIPILLKNLESRKIDPKQLITHRFPFDRILDAYETFKNAATTKALKVIIEA